jgi:hypothetical protein
MKKVIFLILAVMVLMFSGCAGKGPKPQVPMVTKDGEVVIIKDVLAKDIVNPSEETLKVIRSGGYNYDKFSLEERLKRASEESLNSNKKYFALINDGTNNLEGFPLIHYADLVAYCFPYNEKNVKFIDQGHDDKCTVLTQHELKIIMFKEQLPGIYLWDAKATLNDLSKPSF